jgi:uncharacterized membrane protein
MNSNTKTFISDISKKEYPVSEKISARAVRPSVLMIIQKDHPEFTANNFLSLGELYYYQQKYITDFLTNEIGELTELEHNVIDSISDKKIITKKVDDEYQKLTFGQKIADKVAYFGGSWKFIISFFGFLLIWILLNVYWFMNKGFDPYPFILLNLILSCLAALQAPFIMMSQNRQEEKDRERSKKDYMINLKSELEIRILHEKLDHMILNQEQELSEIHKTQIDIMNDILNKVEKK